ncbi:nucleotidyltransferase [Virgibacillus siamensis]|uniref:nucleotidyltransferase n=1 Tax=Virgibacillus siamensis TaxID=480071 RepID=UPI000986BCCF|nr:nucleotidyltransferase [Virgibacillus siamensis]
MTKIRKIGSFCKINESGYIVNTASAQKISPEFHKVLNQTINCYRIHLGESLHSIYVRGSIPHGQAIKGISDLDTIAITNDNVNSMDLQWVDESEQDINAKFDCVNGVEISVYPKKDVMVTSRFSIIPFMLKTHSVCVYGKDFTCQLPSYKADKKLANHHLVNLKKQLEQAKEDLEDNHDREDILDCCSWIMKIIVRAGLALVIEEEKQYTRDLYPAYQLFSKHYPDKEPKMRQALLYAIAPIANTKELTGFLEQVDEWLIAKTENWLEVYNPYNVLEMNLM